MEIENTEIADLCIIKNQIHSDQRGSFNEWFRADLINKHISSDFQPKQANISRSDKGVLRGIHYSVSKTGQSKLIICAVGSIIDVVVDLRLGSPTFGAKKKFDLDSKAGIALYVGAGLGHSFLSKEDGTTVIYIQNEIFSPQFELAINPFDHSIHIKWPLLDYVLSQKDEEAPSLQQRIERHELPRFIK